MEVSAPVAPLIASPETLGPPKVDTYKNRAVGSTAVRALLLTGGLSLLVYVSALVGGTVLSHLGGAPMEAILSFGLAALLYLVTEELLREAHEEGETRIGTALFFAGFLLFLIVGMTLG